MVDMDKARLIDSSGINDADQFPWQLLFVSSLSRDQSNNGCLKD